jgi:hypothetical protein
MPDDLVHHDLITVPLWGDRPGIFWLRLYRGQGRYVAVVTAVPGDPSGSITNCISRVAYHVQRQLTSRRVSLSCTRYGPWGHQRWMTRQRSAG